MSNYPSDFDNDATIPSVIDGSSEYNAETFNRLKEAIIAIQTAIGVDPQGSLSSLVERIATSINSDGTLKSSALLAAGLISLPITNSQIGSSAAIEESKLDLDFATQTLKDLITSNSISISALQDAVIGLLGDFASHVDGEDFNHDGYSIFLDNNEVGSPSWLIGFDATTVSAAFAAITLDYDNHKSVDAISAHLAKNIGIDPLVSVQADNVQEALEGLEDYRAAELISHRDSLHANGISNWENNTAGWNTNLQKFSGNITTTSESVFTLPASVSTYGVVAGDVLVIDDVGYTIVRVGPFTGWGAIPTLSSDQIEIAGSLTEGATIGCSIFGKSSVSNLRVALSSAVFPGNSTMDSIVLAKPNAAKLVSLGIFPQLVGTSDFLELEVNYYSQTKTITLDNLSYSRDGLSPISKVTLKTIADRINWEIANGSAIGAPVLAYVIGNELALVHNFSDNKNCSLKIVDGDGEIKRAFQNASHFDVEVIPTISNVFWVDGREHTDFKVLLNSSVTISSDTISVSGSDFQALGIKAGMLAHLTEASVATEAGSYLITAVGTDTFSISSSLTSTTGSLRVDSSSVSLASFSGAAVSSIANVFLDKDANTGISLRGKYSDSISGVKILSIGDSFKSGTNTLTVTADGTDRIFSLSSNVDQQKVTVAETFVGILKIFNSTNIDFIEVETNGAIGTGSTVLTTFNPIDEEDLFEVCQLRISSLFVDYISDTRLFGSIGLDEIREDVVQYFIETPLVELRSNGAIRGFGILTDNIDLSLVEGYGAGVRGILLDGGIGYVAGTRVSQPSQYIPIPAVDGSYIVVITKNSAYEVLSSSEYSLADIIERKGGNYLPILTTTRSSGVISSTSVINFISNLDSRVDQVLDLTNNFTGNFNSVPAAIAYLNAYPDNEKKKLRVVSATDDVVDLSDISAELELQIEGKVGELVSSNSIIVNGVSGIDRSDYHADLITYSGQKGTFRNLRLKEVQIDTSLVTDAEYLFKDCIFEDAVVNIDDATGQILAIGFDNCRFTGSSISFVINSLATESCKIKISQSSFDVDGELTLTAAECEISDTVFDKTFINWLGLSGTFVDFKNVQFLNHTLAASDYLYSCSLGSTTIDNLFVDNLTINAVTSAFALDTASTNRVSNVIVKTVTFGHSTPSSTPWFIDGGNKASLSNVNIEQGPSFSIPFVSANEVSFLTYDSAGTDIIRISANYVSNCQNIRIVRPFDAGYILNVNNSLIKGTSLDPSILWSDGLRVNNCYFIMDSGEIAIGASGTTSLVGVSLSNNYFDGSGYSLDFGSLPSINGDIINCNMSIDVLDNSAQLSDLRFNSCIFASSFELNAERSVSFRDCIFEDTLKISGTHESTSLANCTGDIWVSGNSTQLNIAGFTGTAQLDGYHQFAQLSNLTVDFSTNILGCSLVDTNISDSSFANFVGTYLTLEKTKIANSLFATAVSFLSNGNNSFSNSSFSNDITITSLSSSNDTFEACVGVSNASTVTFTGTTSGLNFSNNRGISIDAPYLNTEFVLIGNTASDFDLGAISSAKISNNKLDTFSTSGNCSNLVLTACEIGSTANLFVGGATVSKVIIDSLICPYLVIGESISSGATYSNVFIDKCISTELSLFPTNTSATFEYDMIVSNCSLSSLLIFNDGEPTSISSSSNMHIIGGRSTLYYAGTISPSLTDLATKYIKVTGSVLRLTPTTGERVSSSFYTVYKDSDEARTSLSLADDSDLVLSIEKGKYEFELIAPLTYSGSDTISYNFRVTAGSMDIIAHQTGSSGSNGGTATIQSRIDYTATALSANLTLVGNSTAGHIHVIKTTGVINATNSCSFAFRWCTTSANTITVKEGAMLKLTPIS